MINRFSRVYLAMVASLLLLAPGVRCDKMTGNACITILKVNGKPAKGAIVVLYSGPSGFDPMPYSNLRMDKKGRYCLHDLKAGTYVLSASYDSFSGKHHYGLKNLEGKVEVVAGETREYAFSLVPNILVCTGPAFANTGPVDEPMMTTVFDENDLQEIPSGSVGGR